MQITGKIGKKLANHTLVCFDVIFYSSHTLNLFTDATAISGAFHGQGSGPVLYSDVACLGSELSVAECPANNQPTCTHADDASVRCETSKTLENHKKDIADTDIIMINL